MSDDTRRPRRIIQVPLTPAASHLPEVAPPLMQQRFLRVLQAGSTRRPDRSLEPRAERAAQPAPQSSPPAVATPPPAPQLRPDQAAAPKPDATPAKPRQAAGSSRPRPDEPPPLHDFLTHYDEPDAWRHAGLPGPAPDHWDGDLAHRIVSLCRSADPAMQSWTITVPLDPTVLPETELRLSLSPHAVSLRFHTHSPYSQRLVLRHRPRLTHLLAQALPEPARDIDVDLT